MPRATVDISLTKRFDLKTLPEGFVVIRRLSYGEVLERQAMVTMSFVSEQDKRGRTGKTVKSELAMANVNVTLFEFSKSIVEHNLEDERGKLLNLASPVDLQKLDPRVGQEINQLITKYNRLDEEYDVEEGDGQGN